VLVVGGAQSGLQIAEDLADAGQRVQLCTSRVGRMPRRYRGRDVDAWLDAQGYYEVPTAEVPAEELTARRPQISGADGGHTLSLRRLAAKGVMLLGRVAGVDGHRLRFADDLPANSAHADHASMRLKRRIDAHIAAVGLRAPADVADPDDDPPPPEALRQSPLELDIKAAGIHTVIWATGFGPDTGWLQLPVLDHAGQVKHHAGATAMPGLFVTGVPWLRTRKSGIVYGAADDGAHIAALAAGRADVAC
jgi:putative flavoprotein involved in K+ transport